MEEKEKNQFIYHFTFVYLSVSYEINKEK